MEIKARYYDGKEARSFSVNLQLQDNGIQIFNLEDNINSFWYYKNIQVLQAEKYHTLTILSNTKYNEARILVDKKTFNLIYAQMVQFIDPKIRPFFSSKILYLFPFLSLMLIACLFYSIPNFSRTISNHLPLSLEIAVGNYASRVLFSKKELDIYPDQQKILLKIVNQLKKTQNIQRDFNVYVVDSDESPNAFALPNGHIYILKSLIKSADSPEELAGVMAHEMAHIIQHHSMISLIQNTTLSLLVQALLGIEDQYAQLMLNPYNQELEKEADELAGKMLYLANIGTAGLQDFFKKLSNEESSFLSFLASHPSSAERLLYLQQIPAPKKKIAVITKTEWQILKKGMRLPTRE